MTTPSPRPLSRRGLTRTAIWAAPAVTLVAAAPAYAASGDKAVLQVVSASGYWLPGSTATAGTFRFSLSLRNAGTLDATGGIVFVRPSPTGAALTLSAPPPTAPPTASFLVMVTTAEIHVLFATLPANGVVDVVDHEVTVTDGMVGTAPEIGDPIVFTIAADTADGAGGRTTASSSFTLQSGPPTT